MLEIVPQIEVLVGMIGSGKSTYARKRAMSGALVICHDSLTAMLHAEYRYEQTLRQCYRDMEEALARIALKAGRDVVIDRTHLTRESRQRWMYFARHLESNYSTYCTRPTIIAVTFPIETPEVHAQRRFAADARGRPLSKWIEVACHHAEQAKHEPIDKTEGFDSIVAWIAGDIDA